MPKHNKSLKLNKKSKLSFVNKTLLRDCTVEIYFWISGELYICLLWTRHSTFFLLPKEYLFLLLYRWRYLKVYHASEWYFLHMRLYIWQLLQKKKVSSEHLIEFWFCIDEPCNIKIPTSIFWSLYANYIYCLWWSTQSRYDNSSMVNLFFLFSKSNFPVYHLSR